MSAQPTDELLATVASIDLLSNALRSLNTAISSERASERYVAAHIAALRAAAALLASHAQPNKRRPTSVWVLLVNRFPEFSEWAQFFTVTAKKRAAAEAGVRDAVTPREADDLVRDAQDFIDAVTEKLGISRQLTLPVQNATFVEPHAKSNVLQFKSRTA